MNLTPFNFEDQPVRVFTDDSGNSLFVAGDVCKVLEHSDTSKAVSRLDDDEKLTRTLFVSGQNREVLLITESGLYSLVLTSRKSEAKKFKKWVTSEVLPSIRKTGGYNAHQVQGSLAGDLEAVSVLARMLNVSESGKITMARVALEHLAPHLLPVLPAYAVDAPTGAVAGSSEPTASLTVLLKKFGVDGTAAQWNKLLHSAGMLEQLERKRSTGRMHKFWSVSKDGLQFGKNVTSPENPRETSPHWYEGKFLSLLDYVCMV